MKPSQRFGDRGIPACLLIVGVAFGLIATCGPIGGRAAESGAGSPTLAADNPKSKIENDSKEDKESRKLSAEIDKLEFENSFGGRWVAPAMIPILVALLGVAGSGFAAWRTIENEREKLLQQIRAEVDRATHEKRLECYAELTKAMSPLALFFPEYGLDRCRCLEIGNAMSQWYFSTGGLLLSREARDEYFRLARALTKASRSETILAPAWDQYAESMNDKNMNKYREVLGLSLKTKWDKQTKKRVESWEFGKSGIKVETPPETLKFLDKEIPIALAFKDYIILQTLSSRLRSALAEDIAGRRRPLGGPAGSKPTGAQNTASSKAGSTERPHGPS